MLLLLFSTIVKCYFFTESVYGPTVLLEPSMHSVILIIIPRTPAVASADIVGYRILIYGPFADEISLSENIR